MKLRIHRGPQASVLLITLLTGAITGMSLASYLLLVSNQNQSTMRSLAWNSALSIAEAGAEEALTQLQYNDLNHLSANNWAALTNGWYYKKHFVDSASYYEVTIKQVAPPIIVSTASVPAPLKPTTSNPYLKRCIRVDTKGKPLFMGAMIAKQKIDFSGGGVTTDGFDSSDPLYSTLGKYDSAKNKASGDVATNVGGKGAIAAGNAIIKGHVSTGAGGTVSQQGTGSVGDLTWTASSTGIEPGWSSDDAKITIDDVKEPFTADYSTPIGGKVGTNTYTYILDQSQNYKLSSFSGQVLVTGHATLWVTDSVNFGSNDYIYLAPGASLKLYVSAPSAVITGVNNIDGYAPNFQYYGLPTNTSVAFKGNAAYTATVYAPEADFTLGGGGNNDYDFVGACTVNTAKMNGHFHFHFDEALGKSVVTGYVVIAWNELDPNAPLN